MNPNDTSATERRFRYNCNSTSQKAYHQQIPHKRVPKAEHWQQDLVSKVVDTKHKAECRWDVEEIHYFQVLSAYSMTPA